MRTPVKAAAGLVALLLGVYILVGCSASSGDVVDKVEAELFKMAEVMEVPPYHLSADDIEYVVSRARAEGWGSVRPKAGRVEIYANDQYFCLHLPRDISEERVVFNAPC